MGTRTNHLKQSHKNSEIAADARSTSYLNSNNDEFVKYMSKLPGYLQPMERGEESNVLNVGVLDWARLQKWKHARGQCMRKVSPALTTVPKIDDQVHACSILAKVKASRDLQHSSHPVRCTLEQPKLASRDSLNKQDVATCRFKSSGLGRKSRSHLHTTLVVPDKESEKIHAQEARERASKSCGKQCAHNLENHHVSNIVLLKSRKQSPSTLSGEPHKSLDDNVKVTRDFSHGINSSLGLTSQIPRSCPLSFDSEEMRLPLGADLSGKIERFGGTTRHSSRIFDQEMREDESRKKKFVSRSFTDSSTGQPLRSSSDDTIKSDSMAFDGSACPSQSSNPEKKKHNQCGSRVSPLRRLLRDPLLKSKGSENVLPSSCSNPKPTNIDVPFQKKDTWRTRALFQLTLRNGIPLFQFVVDDNKSILGATMKNSVSKDDDAAKYFTFYSVNEVKKKKRGSWLIHHGHREKQGGFVYNVIGQMSSELKSKSISSVMRESVLVDEGRKEVAAVVMKKKPLEETTVIIPGGVHSFPEKGAPTPLVSRWRSGGLCDCGGWDVGCKLHVLSNKTLLLELDKSFNLFNQEESDQDSGPVMAMTELKTGMYSVKYDSLLSHLQAFFVCVTVITSASDEETASNSTAKSSSLFAPPLSPVGRV